MKKSTMHPSTVSQNRRRILVAAAAMSVPPHWVWAASLRPTPAQTSGPFYPEQLPLDDDNDLTRVAGRDGRAKGRITDLWGQVMDSNGRPLAGIRIEIWQCDAHGRYHHPRDNRQTPLDENFQGHGHTNTGAEGIYRFRTIFPVPYPGRTPHIHTAVFLPGQKPFVTQIYNKDEPGNAQDFLFNRIPPEQRPLIVANFEPADADDVELTAKFNIVIDATPQQA